jgi:RNA polymerase sigma-70 factor, ECF subfamily
MACLCEINPTSRARVGVAFHRKATEISFPHARNFSTSHPFVLYTTVTRREDTSVSTWPLDLVTTVARAQAGDQVAFDAIYHRFADTLFRFLYARCGSAELAEELYGDIWVRVVEHLPAFRFGRDDPEAAFAAWLFRIAYNRVIDNYRLKGQAPLPLVGTLSSPAAGPEELMIADDERQALRRAIEQLTAEQREVVMLRFFEDRCNADVARLTGRSKNAVKVMQHRALHTLARFLGGRRGGRQSDET